MRLKLFLSMLITSLICGGVALGIDYFYDAIFDRLIASSMSMMLYDLLFGLTILAIPVAWSLIQRPGIALIANLIGASIVISVGNQWNAFSWYFALIPGISYETALLISYVNNRFNPLIIGGIITATTTTIWDWYRNGYNQIPISLLSLLFLIRILSILLSSQVITLLIHSLVTPHLEENYAKHKN